MDSMSYPNGTRSTVDVRREIYARALNVVDAYLSTKFNGADKQRGAETFEIRQITNEMILCAPADTVNTFMACVGYSPGAISGSLVAELRALMRSDLGLDALVYREPERFWLLSKGK